MFHQDRIQQLFTLKDHQAQEVIPFFTQDTFMGPEAKFYKIVKLVMFESCVLYEDLNLNRFIKIPRLRINLKLVSLLSLFARLIPL